MLKTLFDATVVICTYWDGESSRSLAETIHSLLVQKTNLLYEIVIIEQGPKKDTSLELIIPRSKIRIRHLHYPEKLGLAIARKYGVEIAEGKIIAFIDDDAIADENWLTDITSPLLQDERCVGTGGTTLSYGMETLVERFCDADKAQRTPMFDKDGFIISIPNVNAAFKKSAIEAVDYFHKGYERYKKFGIIPGLEDFDITYRLRNKFGKDSLVYVPEAIVAHKHRKTYLGRFKQYHHYGLSVYFWTHINNVDLDSLGGGYSLPRRASMFGFIKEFIKATPYQLNKWKDFKNIESAKFHEKLFFVFMGFAQRFAFYKGCYGMSKKLKKIDGL